MPAPVASALPVPEPNWLPTTPPITAPRIAPAPDGRDATGTTSMLVTWPYSPYTGAEAIGASTTRSVYTGVDEHALIRASAPTAAAERRGLRKDMIGSPGEQRGPRVAGPRQPSRAPCIDHAKGRAQAASDSSHGR